MLHNIFLRKLMEHQQRKVKVNNAHLNLTSLVIFSICAILLIYLIEITPVKNHSLVWQYFEKAKCKAYCKEILCTLGTPGSDKKTSPNLRVKKLGKI